MRVRLRKSPVRRYLDREFGGRRAFALHLLASAETHTRWWRDCCHIDWSRVERLVFVCKGNICRSPYAAAAATARGLNAISAGLEATTDAPADPAACRQGDLRGFSLRTHRATRFAALAIGPADLVVCMEPRHVRQVRQLGVAGQMTLLGLWTTPRRPWIFDPYGASSDYWRVCCDVIDQGIARLGSAMLRCRSTRGRR